MYNPYREEVLKSLTLLWSNLATECCQICLCTSAAPRGFTELGFCESIYRDRRTVESRIEHEGLSFLTITLPEFGKAFERALDDGYVNPSTFPGFARKRKAGKAWELPSFLGGFLGLVFDPSTGVLLDQPSVYAIRSVRQLTLMFGKILLDCSQEREEKAIGDYIECEQELSDFANSDELDAWLRADFRRMAESLFRVLFEDTEQTLWDREEVNPKHGPGAVVDKLRGNAKFNQRAWTSRLQEFFPWEEFLAVNSSFVDELKSEIQLLEPGAEMPVKVITVPKTLKTPRIIAVEPTCMQYVQQGLMALLVDGIGRDNLLTRFIGFDDQAPNQRMAAKGSDKGSLATLDMSEASDRVSNWLVEDLFDCVPYLNGAVQSCRSTRANVCGEVISLAKYASMGSALTFPVEAMVFLTIIFLGIERGLSTQLSRTDLERFVGKVRVYGDDIIIPVEFVQPVIDLLEAFKLRVNRRKSFWTGKFRESCGKEYYAGEDVSIVRVRRVFPSSPADAAEAMSMVSLRNQLYFAGYWQTCRWLDEEIRKVLRYFPVVLPSSSALGRHSFLGFEYEGLSRSTHAPMVKAWRPNPQLPSSKLDGHGALLKCLGYKYRDLPFADPQHLMRSGRPRVVNIKLGNCSPF